MSKKRYILALDAGTSSVRTVLYDTKYNKIIDISQRSFKQIYPRPGWVEHNPGEIWRAQKTTLFNVASNVDTDEIYGIGITNQRETVVAWDKVTGTEVCNAIVWQCRRTVNVCKKLNEDEKLVKLIHQKTGLFPDAYFSATKIKWILDNVPEAKKLVKEDRLLVGTIDTFLIWKLTKGASFVTDVSNASRTMLFNINTLDWDDELLELFKIPRKILPKVVPSSGEVGTTKLLGEEISICGIAGDQQASLFGQGCFEKGSIKNTYGTGCFLLMNTGDSPHLSDKKLITTVGWSVNGKTTYALEGSIFNTGSAVQWLRDEMGLIESSAASEKHATKVTDTNGVYFVSAFTGLGAPWWDADAKGMFTGITRGANKNHLIRAVLEGIAYSTKDVFDFLKQETVLKTTELMVDGGASENNFLMQFQADMLNIKVHRSKTKETTAMGAIFLAGLGSGVYKDMNEIKNLVGTDRIFVSEMKESVRHEKYSGWIEAVKKCIKKG